ncbi:MAG: hypothetical protein IIZ78_06330 [Clostridiales bacterium]|nr:hypothetical protein [Clostridiales bacterium]
MSDTNWMEAEAYDLADKISEKLTMAYKQGVNDAWMNIKSLWNEGVCSFEWSAEEMMLYAERTDKSRKEVEDIANKIGIHALYAMVREMRGENDGRSNQQTGCDR